MDRKRAETCSHWGGDLQTHKRTQAAVLQHTVRPQLITVDSRPSHPPTYTPHRHRLEWRGGWVGGWGRQEERVELGSGVMSRCRFVFLDLSDISEGERGSSGQPPPFTPSLHGDVSTFLANQHGPEYVRGSSNKIYRWGHKTPFMRGGREMS